MSLQAAPFYLINFLQLSSIFGSNCFYITQCLYGLRYLCSIMYSYLSLSKINLTIAKLACTGSSSKEVILHIPSCTVKLQFSRINQFKRNIASVEFEYAILYDLSSFISFPNFIYSNYLLYFTGSSNHSFLTLSFMIGSLLNIVGI